MIAIFRREMRGYFDSLMGVGVIGAFVVLMMLLSLLLDPLNQGGDWFKRGELSMRTFFGVFPWVAAVVVPAVSMRLWAEDRRQATFELLMTLPIPTWQVALGKYLAGLVFLAAMLAGTAAFPLMLANFGQPDWGPVLGGYVACFLLGAAFLAIGMFLSGLTENQALAFFVAMLVCLGLVGLGELRTFFGDLARARPTAALVHLTSLPVVGLAVLAAAVSRDKAVGAGSVAVGLAVNALTYLFDDQPSPPKSEAVVAALGQISVLDHFREIERGVVYTNGLVFIASLVVLFVVLNVWSLESRRHS
ncbi:MAG: ABC-2 transporter permease [Planctomycetes bacterium]|nr:ABC-2 transporter permease [Planctomycetota bacterium]